MKLLIFIYSLSSGGAERVTSNLANHWAEKGWDIVIVTMTGVEKDFYPLHHNIKRISLNMDAKSAGLIDAVKYNYQGIKALRRALKQQQPDIALSMMTTANVLLALAATGLQLPVLGSERIHPPMFPLGRVWELLRRVSYGRLSAVVAQTSESATWLKNHTHASNVVVIPNAVNYPVRLAPPLITPELSFQQRFNLIAVGRLVSQKGFERLICAFSDLAPRFPDWQLTILGEGDCRFDLEALILALNLEKRVSLPGVVGNVGEWYESADLFVMTSLFEGFPNTLTEAMAYGLSVVGVDCDTGPRDIIRHKVDGLLVPQNDPAALVEALATLMDKKALREQYAARAIEIRERLSMEKVAGMWEELFLKLTLKDRV